LFDANPNIRPFEGLSTPVSACPDFAKYDTAWTSLLTCTAGVLFLLSRCPLAGAVENAPDDARPRSLVPSSGHRARRARGCGESGNFLDPSAINFSELPATGASQGPRQAPGTARRRLTDEESPFLPIYHFGRPQLNSASRSRSSKVGVCPDSRRQSLTFAPHLLDAGEGIFSVQNHPILSGRF